MINTLITIFIITYLIRSLKAILGLVFWWQLKEYRWDRMRAHLKTWQGRKVFFNFWGFLKWFLILGFLFFYFYSSGDVSQLWIAIGTIIFIGVFPVIIYPLEALWNLWQLFRGSWLAPHFTVKSFLLILISLVFIGLSFFLLREIIFLKFERDWFLIFLVPLMVDRLLGPFMALMVAVLAIPSIFYKKYLISKAKKKLENYPNLKVIGITGSYGKTSTKEFLAQILSAKFKVLKTQGSNNTTWGVVKIILNDLTDQEIFVCEMGAYRIGEICQICQICRPRIGIITGINEQHLDLFGSLEKTMKAKYELIESLPENGLAVFNGYNEKCREMAGKARERGKIRAVRITGEEIKAEEIKVFKDRLEFKVFKGLKFQKMTARLLGKQNIENLLLAITVADYLGMSLEEISKAIEKIETPEKTMRAVREMGDVGNLIDDTFNTNPDGVLAAIEYIKIYSGKKILVLQPIIELGEYAKQAHEKVGKTAAEVCDLIILTNKNYYRDFRKGFKGNGGIEGKLILAGGNKAAEKIRKVLDKNGVAIFEGKETAGILKLLR